jgi:two-component system nitrate/nitrite response regulator NarL
VSVAGNADEAIRLTRSRADVLILDLLLGDGESGLDVLEALRNLRVGAPVLAMSGSDDLSVVARSLSLGALGFCHKTEPPHVLYDASLEVAAGRAVIAERFIAPLLHLLREEHREREESGAVLARLTEREQEVLRLLSHGLNAAELARRLGVSSSTARTHLRGVMQKLGVNTQLAAAALARELYESVQRPSSSTNETTSSYRPRAVGSGP